MKMNAIIAERRVCTALIKRLSQYADSIFQIGDRALAYTENPDKWNEPLTVTYRDEAMATIKS